MRCVWACMPGVRPTKKHLSHTSQWSYLKQPRQPRPRVIPSNNPRSLRMLSCLLALMHVAGHTKSLTCAPPHTKPDLRTAPLACPSQHQRTQAAGAPCAAAAVEEARAGGGSGGCGGRSSPPALRAPPAVIRAHARDHRVVVPTSRLARLLWEQCASSGRHVNRCMPIYHQAMPTGRCLNRQAGWVA